MLKLNKGYVSFAVFPNGDIYECLESYNKKQIPVLNCKNFDNNIIFDKKNKENIIGINILWVLTLECNYNCDYCGCDKNRSRRIGNDYRSTSVALTSDEWLDFFQKIKENYKKVIITTCLGEPFLHEFSLIKIVKEMQDCFIFNITTNLSRSVLEFGRSIPSRNNVFFNLTLNPLVDSFNFEKFIGRALYLKNIGFDVKVNLASYPEQLYLFERYKNIFKEYDVEVCLFCCE